MIFADYLTEQKNSLQVGDIIWINYSEQDVFYT